MRRILAFLPFLTVAVAVLVGVHWYLVRRLVVDPGIAEPVRSALIWTAVALALALPLQPILRRVAPRLARVLAWPSSIWIGLGFLLLVGVVVTDVLWLVGAWLVPAELAAEFPRVRAIAVAVWGAVAGAVALHGGLRAPRLAKVAFELEGWPRELDGFRIVQLTDVHIGPTLGRRFLERLVERTNALAPDLVAITGDLVDGEVADVGGDVLSIAGLRSRFGTFFVTGNHDHYSRADPWVRHLRGLGVTVLRNRHLVLELEQARFVVAGVDDRQGDPGGTQRADVGAALDGVPPELPIVLLSHDPNTFAAAARHGVGLQISGHTHAGQIWPFRHLVRLATPFVEGHHRLGEAQLYVSRGTGYWGPPMRLGAPAELTEITLYGR